MTIEASQSFVHNHSPSCHLLDDNGCVCGLVPECAKLKKKQSHIPAGPAEARLYCPMTVFVLFQFQPNV